MKKYFFLFAFSLVALSCTSQRPTLEIPKVAKGGVVVDARPNEWRGEPLIQGLVCPWEENLKDETKFYAAHDDDNFYFYFEAVDNTISAIGCAAEDSVMPCDRVELFFSCDDKMNRYYGTEMDPMGKTLDYSAQFYRKCDYKWNFSTLKMVSRIDGDRYIVEGSISKEELRNLNLLKKDGKMLTGVYRGDAQSVGGKFHWYPWVDPKSEGADFHIPSSLGLFIFKE